MKNPTNVFSIVISYLSNIMLKIVKTDGFFVEINVKNKTL